MPGPSRSLREACLKKFGGYDGIAKILHDEYEAAKPGSPTRASLARALLDFVLKSPKGDEEYKDPVSDEEVERELLKMAQRKAHGRSNTA